MWVSGMYNMGPKRVQPAGFLAHDIEASGNTDATGNDDAGAGAEADAGGGQLAGT